VANAGVFVRESAGAYTGLYGATDIAGWYCIAEVPTGVYDLEVRVDNYAVQYVTNVVIDDVTGIDVDLQPARIRLLFGPNPASDHVVFSFRSEVPGLARLEIFDARGRSVRRWQGNIAAENQALTWDFLDAAGHAVPAGVYYIRLRVGSLQTQTKIVRVK
jgi:hypothetical protein